MKDFILKLQKSSVHLVGVTGAEGSSILRFLVKHNVTNITVHDFLKEKTIEENFRLWHKGLSTIEREKLLTQFKSDLAFAKQNFQSEYLAGIETADIIFVPQSWRLYKKQNQPLFEIKGKIPFYSLTRLYLDFARAKIVAVTGTIGKGSTANIIFQFLKRSLPVKRRVYFAGNETWMIQLADKIDEMNKDDILILEISHRQLQDGFTRTPYLTVVTNLYPNHLDEVDWETYVKLKLSLLNKQKNSDVSILNYDVPELRLKDRLKSKVLYFSEKAPDMNTKSVQKVYEQIMSNKSNQYLPNLLAAFSALDVLGINITRLVSFLDKLKSLPARLELLETIKGVDIFDDIKSTTPWATLAAIKRLGKKTILICGGRTKGIDYVPFMKQAKDQVKFVLALKSEMSEKISKMLSTADYEEVDDLQQALDEAYLRAKTGDNILISPAAGFFYSDFIRGKKSLRKLITSLLPREPA